MFFRTSVSSPIDQVHIIFLTQVSGPLLPRMKAGGHIVKRNGSLFHEAGEHPDRWTHTWPNPPYTDHPALSKLSFVTDPQSVGHTDDVWLEKISSPAARNYNVKKFFNSREGRP